MKSKKIIIILGIVLVLIISLCIGVFVWYSSNLKPVSKEESEAIRIEISEGMGVSKIADLLEQSNVIKSANAMKIYAKVNNIGALQAGKYDLNNNENMQTILSHIVNGEVVSDEIKITFVEGKKYEMDC